MPDIRSMFASISSGYDLLNHILSFGLDYLWRKKLVSMASKYLPLENSSVLDIASGTGDVAFAFLEFSNNITASDFCPEMLYIAKEKSESYASNIHFTCSNAEELNFKDKSFNVVTNAFALRNIKNLKKAFFEMRRVLKNGGACLSLEFGRPENILLKPFFFIYLNIILPVIGLIFSLNYEAYKYLSTSIQEFMTPDELCSIIINAGFKNVHYVSLSYGIVNIYIGEI